MQLANKFYIQRKKKEAGTRKWGLRFASQRVSPNSVSVFACFQLAAMAKMNYIYSFNFLLN